MIKEKIKEHGVEVLGFKKGKNNENKLKALLKMISTEEDRKAIMEVYNTMNIIGPDYPASPVKFKVREGKISKSSIEDNTVIIEVAGDKYNQARYKTVPSDWFLSVEQKYINFTGNEISKGVCTYWDNSVQKITEDFLREGFYTDDDGKVLVVVNGLQYLNREDLSK